MKRKQALLKMILLLVVKHQRIKWIVLNHQMTNQVLENMLLKACQKHCHCQGLRRLRERPAIDYREQDSFSEDNSWHSDELEYPREDSVHISEVFTDEVKD